MGEMENKAEFYYEKLKSNVDPAITLREFFTEITGRPVGRVEIIMINRLLKIFGRFTLFFSIMDLSNVRDLRENLYGILYTICRNRFEKSHVDGNVRAFEPLNKELASIRKQMEKIKDEKFTPPDSKGLING